MKKYTCILLALALIAGSLLAGGALAEKKISVVATIFPVYDWAREIVGDADNVELTMLQDSGVDLHSYQPTAQEIMKIATCDLFVYVGGESDEWVAGALKESVNPNMKVINLLEALGEGAKEEALVEGMEEGHDHDQFEDGDVKDRTLSDWYGEWRSLYPLLLDGSLDEVIAHKAEEGGKAVQECYDYYKTGYATDVERIVIDDESIAFYRDGKKAESPYDYRGYQIYTYESGSRGVRYFFEARNPESGAPRYVQFSDHEIAPTEAEHFHLYWGDESFDALSENMVNWPTYYPAEYDVQEIVDAMLDHNHHTEEVEYDEHVWLSLRNAQALCRAIADALAAIDPDGAETYQANAREYEAELAALDMEYVKAVEAADVRTVLFGDRFPFRYLVDDYGLNYYAAFAGCSAETEASFETIVFLAGKTDEFKLPAVMAIEGTDHRIAETIVQNTRDKDQRVLVMDSMQGATAADAAAGRTYLDAMRANLEVLRQALSGK